MSSDSELDEALRRTKTPETIEERQAFASLWGRVVGKPKGPLTLARYILLERVGSGGAGVVYSAYDPELDRKVAIKLLRTGSESDAEARESRARLLREAQAMAKLSHPNVIAVHDVGTYGEKDLGGAAGGDDTEVPARGVFLVMELVDGKGLDKWLAGDEPGWRDVIPVFVAAGRGLAAAHDGGVIHRDFKPANVLLGNDGRVRVLDFGLARGVADEPEPEPAPPRDRAETSGEIRPNDGTTRRTGPPPGATDSPHHLDAPLTRRGTVMGTPPYMAPEQHRAGATDARTDQYNFCVALYEALYGRRPFVGDDLDELLAAKEHDPPPPPQGSDVPAWVHAVVARGMRADPEQRHASMDALLAALDRDPGARRRRWLAAAGALATTAVVSAGVVSLQQQNELACSGQEERLAGIWDGATRSAIERAFRATDKPYVDRVWTTVAGRLDEYAQRWTRAREEACTAAVVRGELSPAAMGQRMLCLDRQLNRVGELSRLFAEPDAEIVEHAVAAVMTLPDVDACLADDASDPIGADEATRERVLAVDRDLARAEALRQAAKYGEARAGAQRALEAAKDMGNTTMHARALLLLGQVEHDEGNLPAAEPLFDRAFEIAELGGHDEVAVGSLAELVYLVGTVLARHREADRLGRLAMTKVERHGLGDLIRATVLQRVASLESTRSLYAEALESYGQALALLERTLGPAHPRVADVLEGIGTVHTVQGDFEAAHDHFRRALAIREGTVGLEHPRVAKLHEHFARLHTAQGRYAQADEQLDEALDILRRTVGEEHPRFAWALHTRGFLYNQSGRHADALPYLRRAREMFERSLGKSHPWVSIATANIGVSLWRLGRTEEALEHAARGSAGIEEIYGASHVSTVFLEMFRARVLGDLGRHDEALDVFTRNQATLEQLLGAEHPRMIEAHSGIGRTRVAMGQRDQGIEELERAVALGEELRLRPGAYSDVLRDLASAVEDGDPQRAQALRARADAAEASARGGRELGPLVDPFRSSQQ